MIGEISLNFSSPSSRFTLLIIILPGHNFIASLMTSISVESIIIGALIFEVNFSKNCFISYISSLSGFCKQTSITLAPELICNFPISEAWSKSSFSISLLNLFEPKTLVLSPTNIGLVDSSTYKDSKPVT